LVPFKLPWMWRYYISKNVTNETKPLSEIAWQLNCLATMSFLQQQSVVSSNAVNSELPGT